MGGFISREIKINGDFSWKAKSYAGCPRVPLWRGAHEAGAAPSPPKLSKTLTLHLGLVNQQELGGAAALELLSRAPLGAELLVLALVKGEERGGEAAEAGGAGQRRQRVFLRGWTQGQSHPCCLPFPLCTAPGRFGCPPGVGTHSLLHAPKVSGFIPIPWCCSW